MEITYDDVLEILEIIESSNVEYLEIEVGGTKIVASKSGITSQSSTSSQFQIEPSVKNTTQVQSPPPLKTSEQKLQEIQPPTTPSSPTVDTNLITVAAPVVGVFYRQAEPGTPPYVEIGSKVSEGDTLGLLEVMKMFTSVTSPVNGVIVEILAENNEFVEFEQTLLLIKPESNA